MSSPTSAEYRQGMDDFVMFATMTLFSLAKHGTDTARDRVVRNFIARSAMTLKAMAALSDLNDPTDGWILFSCLLDRLFHLHALAQDDSFEAFEDWSFKKGYEYSLRVRSDPFARGKIDPSMWTFFRGKEQRYREVACKKVTWRRPHPETAAKQMGLDFLYDYGYDYASAVVHPIAFDGCVDFLVLTKIDDGSGGLERDSLFLHNSCVVATMIIQECLNASNLTWRGAAFNFLDSFREFLMDSSSVDYRSHLYSAAQFHAADELCCRSQKHGGAGNS